MIIKRITINNYRSYYKSNTFDFKEGLTLIIGDNGDGKTTFFEALQWLLKTDLEDSSLEHFSEMRKEELEIGESDRVSVSLDFEHDGEKSVTKSFIVERTSEDKFTTKSFSFVGYETRNSERVQGSGKFLISRCFDSFIQRYSMFKGESNLNVFDDKQALKMLVDKLSDIHEFDVYEELTSSFEEKSYKAYEKECKSDKKTKSEAERLGTLKEQVVRDLNNNRLEIIDCKRSSEAFASKIEVLESNKEASERYQDIKSIIKSREQKVAELKGKIGREDLNINLLDKMWILAPFSKVFSEYKKKIASFNKEKRRQHESFLKEQGVKAGKQEIIEQISTLDNGSAKLPWYLPDEKTMQEMIDDEICKVCGRTAHKGSEPYEFMVKKLAEHLAHLKVQNKAEEDNENPKEEFLFVNRYIDELTNISISLGGDNEREVTTLPSLIKDKLDLIDRFKQDLDVAKSRLVEAEDDKARLLIQTDGLTEEQLDLDFTNLKGYFEQKGKADIRLAELKQKEQGLLEKQKEVNKAIEDLNPTSCMAKTYQRVHTTLEKIAKAFKEAKETNLREFLDNLEQCANNYMDRLNENDFHGEIRLVRTVEAETTIKIKLMSENKTEIKNPGGAQRTTMYMSVLFAISDLTSSKQEENYPLIFDAPTSSFGSIKEEVFYNIIDKIDKQCIIVTKDLLVNGNLDYNKINDLTCSIYRIRKAPGFNKNNLATIRTQIEKVK